MDEKELLSTYEVGMHMWTQERARQSRKPNAKKLLYRGILVMLGGYLWFMHGSKSPEPFATIPDGGPGSHYLGPCGKKGFDCGYIIVPKDYFNSSAGTARIAVARHRALKQPSRGSIMINPGGPGGSGVATVMFGAEMLRREVGDDWDLIGFDPRGVGRTLPRTKCFPDNLSHQLLYENTPFVQAYTVPVTGNLSDPSNHLYLTDQSRQFLAVAEARANLCSENMDVEDLRYMGTATVVRDMELMTRVLDGEGAKINYLGGSYGSVLGAYLVNMLPHRTGYTTIDGVVDMITWANEPSHTWHKGWTSSAEKAYRFFLNDCHEAGPRLCAVAHQEDTSPHDIEARIEDFIQSLVAKPLVASFAGRPGYITSGAARGILYYSLAAPRNQPSISQAFADAMSDQKNGTALLSRLQNPIGAPPGHGGDISLARLGVTCADSPSKPVPTAEDLADELLTGLTRHGRFAASPIFTEPDGGCQFWPTRDRSAERFTGPWNASLDYPMLIISNTADPVTPIASGLLINRHMVNSSTMVIQNGPGHCSLALASLCTFKMKRAYWAGNPPKNGTWCETDEKVFKGDQAGNLAMTAEDADLLRNMKELSAITESVRSGLQW